jgi:hypothetical protein
MLTYLIPATIFILLTIGFFKLEKLNRATICGIIGIIILWNFISDYKLLDGDFIKKYTYSSQYSERLKHDE